MPKLLARISLAAALASTVYSTAVAQSSPDSTTKKNETHTLFSGRWVKAVHFDLGGGSVPYLDHSGNTVEVRLGLAFAALPDWTFAWSGNLVSPTDTTSYVAPGSAFHPEVSSAAQSFEVQRRWRSERLFHPMATAAIGKLGMSYNYWEHPKTGGSVLHEDGKTTGTVMSLAGGGELNLTRWMRWTILLGYRHAPTMQLPAVTASNSGMIVTSLFEFGKF